MNKFFRVLLVEFIPKMRTLEGNIRCPANKTYSHELNKETKEWED
jgi:hypothetical protein